MLRVQSRIETEVAGCDSFAVEVLVGVASAFVTEAGARVQPACAGA